MTLLEEVIRDSPRLKPRTKVLYAKAVRRFLRVAGEDPAGWTPAAAQRFYNALLQPADGRPGVKPQTANGVLYALRYAGERAAALQGDPRLDFAALVELAPDLAGEKRRALTREDAQLILTSCAAGTAPVDLRDRALLGLLLRTGMRRMSACGIDLADWRRDGAGHRVVEIRLKGGARHEVPVTDSIEADAAPWRRWLSARGITGGRLFRGLAPSSGRADTRDGAHVGERLTEHGLYEVVEARADAAGVKIHVHPHLFRHTFVSWCQAMRVPTYAIVAVTGHQLERGASIVDRVYTDPRVAGTTAIDAIDRYLAGEEQKPK